MSVTVVVTLSDREAEALAEVRTRLGFHTDEQTILGGLYKLAAFVEPNVDPALFRLDRATALRETEPDPDPREREDVETETWVVEVGPVQPDLFEDAETEAGDGVPAGDGTRAPSGAVPD